MRIEVKAKPENRRALLALGIADKEANKRLAYAVNGAGFRGRRGLVGQWRRELKSVSHSTSRGLQYWLAKPGPNPTGTIAVSAQAWEWMRWQIEGGVRRFRSWNFIPFKGRKRSGRKFVIPLKSGNRLVLYRPARKKAKAVLAGVEIREAKYRKRASGIGWLRARMPGYVKESVEAQLEQVVKDLDTPGG